MMKNGSQFAISKKLVIVLFSMSFFTGGIIAGVSTPFDVISSESFLQTPLPDMRFKQDFVVDYSLDVQPTNVELSYIQWIRTYPEMTYDLCQGGDQTSDGGYILTGYSYASDRPHKLLLLKTDSTGQKEWQRFYGGKDEAGGGYDVQQTRDGGYIAVGWDGFTDSHYQYDAWIIKTDDQGEVEWEQSFGGSSWDSAFSVFQTDDDGFIIGGYDNSKSAWLIKLDKNGTFEWDRTYRDPSDPCFYHIAYSVIQCADGGFALAGYKYQSSYDYNGFLWKTDSLGNEEWNITLGVYERGQTERIYCVKQTLDGGFIVSGERKNQDTNYKDLWLVKTDANGTILWNETYGLEQVHEIGYCVEQLDDEGFLVAGEIGYDVYVVRTDKNGLLLWELAIPFELSDRAMMMQQTTDNGFILGGYKEAWLRDSDIFLVKLSAETDNPIAPEIPSLTGTEVGRVGVTGNYSISTIDVEGDDVFYFIDWGDETSEDWFGPFLGGEQVHVYHTWEEQGDFVVRVKARDGGKAESDWAELNVEMETSLSFFMNNPLLSRFSLLNRILNLNGGIV